MNFNKDYFDKIRRDRTENERFSKGKIIIISLISAAIILLIGVVLSQIKIGVSERSQDIIPTDTKSTLITKPIEVFFLTDDGVTYRGKIREIPFSDDITVELKSVIEELIAGPKCDSLYSALPMTASVRSVFVDNSERLYIDFDSKLIEDTCEGTACEVAILKTIAKTIATNFPDIYQFQILIEGEPAKNLGGYLDISRPFYIIDWI